MARNLGPETRGSGPQPRRGGCRVECRRSLHAPTRARTRPTLAYANTRVPSRRLTSSHAPSHIHTHTHGSHHTFHARPHACPACQPHLLSESPRNPVLSSLWQGPRPRMPRVPSTSWAAWDQNPRFRTAEQRVPSRKAGAPVSQIWVAPSTPEFLEMPQEQSLASYAADVILCLKVSGKSQDRYSKGPSPSPSTFWRGTLGPFEAEPLSPTRWGCPCPPDGPVPSVTPWGPLASPQPCIHSLNSRFPGEPGTRNRGAKGDGSCDPTALSDTPPSSGQPPPSPLQTSPFLPTFWRPRSRPGTPRTSHVHLLLENVSTALPQDSAPIRKQPAEVLVREAPCTHVPTRAQARMHVHTRAHAHTRA